MTKRTLTRGEPALGRRRLAVGFVKTVPLRFPMSANRAREEMRIDFPNTVELGFYFNVFETGAAECAPPMIRGEKTRIRSKFWIGIDVGKTIQDLKYQFRIHRLVEIRPHTLADYEATIRRERTTGLP
jgi:hypothetical protein